MLINKAVCLNLGPKEIRKRRLIGYVCFMLGLTLATFFVVLNVSDGVRLLVMIPFFFAYLGIFQSMQKTCIVLGLKGQQNLDQGTEHVSDETMRKRLQFRSITILVFSLLMAAFCTYLTLIIHPEMMLGVGDAPRQVTGH